MCLRSEFRGQLIDGDSHLPRLQVQQTGLVSHTAQIIGQERCETGKPELCAPDIGRYLDKTRHLQSTMTQCICAFGALTMLAERQNHLVCEKLLKNIQRFSFIESGSTRNKA